MDNLNYMHNLTGHPATFTTGCIKGKAMVEQGYSYFTL